MPIEQVFNKKVQELNKLVNDNTLDPQQLGQQLFNLYANGWGQQEPRYIKPIIPGDFLRNPNGIFGQQPDRYGTFSQDILALLQTKDLKTFLDNFLNNITIPHNMIAPQNIQIARYVNGWYIGTFFLAIKYPTEYLWVFSYNTIQNALINVHLANPNQVNFFKRTPHNIQPYLDLMNQLKQHNNYNGNFLNLLNYIENNYQFPPPQPPIIVYTKNTILFGPPGTGKTYNTINKSLEIIDPAFFDANKNNRGALKGHFDKLLNTQIRFVTFHQSYSYEEFVEGLRAKTDNNGNISYIITPGIFKEICEKAKIDTNKKYVLIIDEINRGNISKIFGELITLIEESKREGQHEALSATLPYSNEYFSVPNNLYIIGTMNTADRSLALMDTALRRRFDFIEMLPDIDLLYDNNGSPIIVENIEISYMLETMNQRIEILYDREHTLGHAFFMPLIDEPTIENLAGIFKNKIIPLLQEYFFENWENIRIVLGDDNKSEADQFIRENKSNLDCFSSTVKEKYNRLNNVKNYYLNDSALISQSAYIGIYE